MKQIWILIFITLVVNLISAQNVGINTTNPQEQLHIRSDSTKMAIRLDSKKSDQEGFDYFSITALPSNAQAIELNPDWKDWTDLNHNKLINSDNTRLTGPQIEIVPDAANVLKVVFNPTSSIPSNAFITDVTLHTEWRRTGDFAGSMGFFITLNRNANNLTLLNFGLQLVDNSTDLLYSLSYQNVLNPLTPDMVNLGDIYVRLNQQFSYIQGLSRLEIDRMWLEVEYKIPSTNNSNVNWSAGVKEGTFRITNSEDLNTNSHLMIDESGITQLKGLRISKNAGAGRVLMSNNDGRASWQDLPFQELETLWFSKEDTVFYGSGPVQVNNKINEAAFIFDKGENRLNNGDNFAETDNRVFNIILDADNDQNNEQFNIYKDSTEALNQTPAVRLNFGGNDSWINGGGNLGIGSTSPTEKLDVNGAVKLGNTANNNAAAGTIRYNPVTQDFEGFNGVKWLSLTTNTGFGTKTGNENQKLMANDGTGNDRYGISVSISGDYAIIGAYYDDIGANTDQGSAYIFVRSGTTWTQQAKLIASDGEQEDNFGFSVSISGVYAIIGAPGDNVGSIIGQGSAYIFIRSGTAWTQQAKLTASDGEFGDAFGNKCSISGDYAIIGASFDDIGGNGFQGSAYIFVRSGTNWTQQAKLTASDGASFDQFGCSVSISGDYAVVGAFLDDIGANTDQGSAYIFKRSGTIWTQQVKLTASDGSLSDWFGISVSISGDYLIIGSQNDDFGSNTYQGSAYIFKRSGMTWEQQAKLSPLDGESNDLFGKSVSISGDYAIIGAFKKDVGVNTSQGSAYIFLRSGTTWTQQAKLTASDGDANDNFGITVSISGSYVITGAYFDDVGANIDQGSAYFFQQN